MKSSIIRNLKKDNEEQIGFSLRLPATVKTDFQKLADNHNVSANSLYVEVLKEFLYGNISKNEQKIIRFLKDYKTILSRELEEIEENNLEEDQKEYYEATVIRKQELEQLLEEIK